MLRRQIGMSILQSPEPGACGAKCGPKAINSNFGNAVREAETAHRDHRLAMEL
jgi:hypothetical protein